MASFDKYTNYKNNAGVSGVVFGADKTVLEVELNEMQEIEKFGLRNMLAKIVGDGITDRSKLTYDGSSVNIASGCGLLVNGILVNCSGLSLAMTSGTAYLQVWEETVSYSDTLKEEGNQQDSDTVANWAKDNRSDVETSKRKVVKYTLATSQESDANNIAIASVAGGVMTKLVNEVNLTNLTSRVDDVQAYIGCTNPEIYGVEVDFKNKRFTRLAGAVDKTPGTSFDDVKAFGGRKRCIIEDGGTVLAYLGDAAYTETGSLLQAVTKGETTYAVGTKVQVMVEQPKFYYKTVPLELEKIVYNEIETLEITGAATSSGNISIELDGETFSVAVASGDTKEQVAEKVRATTFTGWTTGSSGTTKATFTADESGGKDTPTFSGGTTGVTASISVTLSGKQAKGFHMRKARYYVSDTMKSGFKLHPAFMHDGKEKNFIYLSAYEGSLYDVSASAYILDDAQIASFTASTGDKLSSIANTKPISGTSQNLTRGNTRILAKNRGTGWFQQYVATASATQMLFTIEYASMNMQTKLGAGNTNKPYHDNVNHSEITGATTNLGNASGSVTNVNDINIITYRGEENFFGNIWKWVDGLNINAKGLNELYVADHSFADDKLDDHYVNTGFTLARTNGYISAFGYSEGFDWMFMTSETKGDSSLPVGDYFYQNHITNGMYVARLGSCWNDSSMAGGFYWSVHSSSASRTLSIGGRLVYVPDVVAS